MAQNLDFMKVMIYPKLDKYVYDYMIEINDCAIKTSSFRINDFSALQVLFL